MRKVAIIACLAALSNMAVAQEWEELRAGLYPLWAPVSQEQQQAGQMLLQRYPLNVQMAGNRDLEDVYGRACTAAAYHLGDIQHQYEDALRVTGAYLAVFPRPTTQLASAVHALHLRYLLKANASAQEALQAAQASAQRVLAADSPSFSVNHQMAKTVGGDEGSYLDAILALYEHAGEPEEAEKFIQDVALSYPEYLSHAWYWQRAVATYMRHGQVDKAKQRAVWAFRVCRFVQMDVDMTLGWLLRSLTASGERFGWRRHPVWAWTCLGNSSAGHVTTTPSVF